MEENNFKVKKMKLTTYFVMFNLIFSIIAFSFSVGVVSAHDSNSARSANYGEPVCIDGRCRNIATAPVAPGKSKETIEILGEGKGLAGFKGKDDNWNLYQDVTECKKEYLEKMGIEGELTSEQETKMEKACKLGSITEENFNEIFKGGYDKIPQKIKEKIESEDGEFWKNMNGKQRKAYLDSWFKFKGAENDFEFKIDGKPQEDPAQLRIKEGELTFGSQEIMDENFKFEGITEVNLLKNDDNKNKGPQLEFKKNGSSAKIDISPLKGSTLTVGGSPFGTRAGARTSPWEGTSTITKIPGGGGSGGGGGGGGLGGFLGGLFENPLMLALLIGGGVLLFSAMAGDKGETETEATEQGFRSKLKDEGAVAVNSKHGDRKIIVASKEGKEGSIEMTSQDTAIIKGDVIAETEDLVIEPSPEDETVIVMNEDGDSSEEESNSESTSPTTAAVVNEIPYDSPNHPEDINDPQHKSHDVFVLRSVQIINGEIYSDSPESNQWMNIYNKNNRNWDLVRLSGAGEISFFPNSDSEFVFVSGKGLYASSTFGVNLVLPSIASLENEDDSFNVVSNNKKGLVASNDGTLTYSDNVVPLDINGEIIYISKLRENMLA
jgi:hypothetical protein